MDLYLPAFDERLYGCMLTPCERTKVLELVFPRVQDGSGLEVWETISTVEHKLNRDWRFQKAGCYYLRSTEPTVDTVGIFRQQRSTKS